MIPSDSALSRESLPSPPSRSTDPTCPAAEDEGEGSTPSPSDRQGRGPAGALLPFFLLPFGQNRPWTLPVSVSTSMRRKAGSEDVPGMSLMVPAMGTTKPAPL